MKKLVNIMKNEREDWVYILSAERRGEGGGGVRDIVCTGFRGRYCKPGSKVRNVTETVRSDKLGCTGKEGCSAL